MIGRRVRAFGLFWYDFVVGDDWVPAVAVVVALGLTALVAHVAHAAAWWIAPVVVTVALVTSCWRASAGARRKV